MKKLRTSGTSPNLDVPSTSFHSNERKSPVQAAVNRPVLKRALTERNASCAPYPIADCTVASKVGNAQFASTAPAQTPGTRADYQASTLL